MVNRSKIQLVIAILLVGLTISSPTILAMKRKRVPDSGENKPTYKKRKLSVEPGKGASYLNIFNGAITDKPLTYFTNDAILSMKVGDLLSQNTRFISFFTKKGHRLCNIAGATFDGLKKAHKDLIIELRFIDIKTVNWKNLDQAMKKFETKHGHYPKVIYCPDQNNKLYCPLYCPSYVPKS